jgi:hypothetical protein
VGVVSGQLSDQLVGAKFASGSSLIDGVNTYVNEAGEVVFSFNTRDGSKVASRDYVIGKSESGQVVVGSDAGDKYGRGLKQLATVANATLNQTVEGEVRNVDMERIKGEFLNALQSEIDSGRFSVGVSELGRSFDVGGRSVSETDLQSELVGLVEEGMATKNKNVTAVDRVRKWALENGVNLQMTLIAPSGSDKTNKVNVKIGETTTTYDLSTEQGKNDFSRLIMNRAAIPSSTPQPTRQVPVRGGSQGSAVGNFFNQQ